MYFTQINNMVIARLEILIVQNRFHSKLNCSSRGNKRIVSDGKGASEKSEEKELH